MGRKQGHLFQFIRFGLLTGAAALMALGLEVPAAFAGELNDWGYNAETRSLTLTLPPNVSPSVSVLAPNQLLIELPDTQIGDMAGLNVGDGIVNDIVLEQTTPETLWMVMEFAEGTVLATAQSVVPVGDRAEAGQQWEIRPAVMASNEPAAVAQANGSAPVVSSGADSLRTPNVDIAQADFPDLPILEPGIILNEPVSVPPIDAVPTASAPPPPPLPPIAEVRRPIDNSPIEAATDDRAVPTASAPSPPPLPPALPPRAEVSRPIDNSPIEAATNDRDEEAAIAEIPSEPPFLSESTFEVPVINQTAISEGDLADRVEDVAQETRSAEEPVAVSVPDLPALEVDIPLLEADEIPVEVVAAETGSATGPTAEADTVPAETVAAVPSLPTRVDASFAVETTPNADELESKFEPQVLDLSEQGVAPQNIDRWPDPIPFGAPLP